MRNTLARPRGPKGKAAPVYGLRSSHPPDSEISSPMEVSVSGSNDATVVLVGDDYRGSFRTRGINGIM